MSLQRITLAGISRRQLLQGAAGLAGLALAGWGSGSAQAATGVRFQLNWIRNVQFGGMWYALEKGFYRDEGLDVQFNAGGPGVDPISLVANQSALVGFNSNVISVILARSRGAPLVAFGVQFQKSPNCLVCRADSGIQGPSDFLGKRIAVQGVGRASLGVVLRVLNISEDQVRLVNTGFDASSLLTDQADLLTAFSTNQPLQMRAAGVEPRIFLYHDLGFEQQALPMLTTERVLETQPELLEGLLRATIKGWEYAIANPEEVAELTVRKYSEGLDLEQQIGENLAQIELMQIGVAAEKGLFWMDRSIWEQTLKVGREFGLIPDPPNLDELLRYEILERVYGRSA